MRTKKIVITLLILSIFCNLLLFKPITVNATSSALPDGTYRIITKCGKFVDVKDGSNEDGAITHLWEYADVDNQKFNIKKMDDGSYKITPIHSGKPLEVRNSSYDNCADIAQWEFVDGYDCKYWYIYYCENGYYNIVNKNSGKYMDVCGNNTENGTQIFQYEGNGTDAQLFGFLPVDIKFVQGPLSSNIQYILPKPQLYYIPKRHQHTAGNWFGFLVNDTSASMYFVSGRICSTCGNAATYTYIPLPN